MTTLGEASPTVEALIALLGGAVAAGSHLTKTSTRAAANTSPEPFSNWILSIGEDLFVVGLGYLALKYPIAALVVAGILLVLIVLFAAIIIRTVAPVVRSPTGLPDLHSILPAASSSRLMRTRLTLVVSVAAVAALAAQAPQDRSQPTFRAGANYVRVDMYATRDGQSVNDLQATDLEVLEDGVSAESRGLRARRRPVRHHSSDAS